MIGEIRKQLINPRDFFEGVRGEDWKSSLVFFLMITLFISLATPILNYFGMESTDLSSSYQAQIIAYNFAKNNLIPLYGNYAYLLQSILIFAFAVLILLFLTLLLHIVYRLIGGKGPVLNAWKAACYGIGPCVLGGFLPYISLFAGFYSFAMQFYFGPMTLYKVGENKAMLIFVSFIALTFIEKFVLGTTA